LGHSLFAARAAAPIATARKEISVDRFWKNSSLPNGISSLRKFGINKLFRKIQICLSEFKYGTKFSITSDKSAVAVVRDELHGTGKRGSRSLLKEQKTCEHQNSFNSKPRSSPERRRNISYQKFYPHNDISTSQEKREWPQVLIVRRRVSL
jgi:hypothetical protein